MRASRNDLRARPRLALGATLLASALASAPALAQVGPPVSLLPAAPGSAAPPAGGAPANSSASPSAAPPSTATPGPAASQSGISVAPLAAVDPSWIGTLKEGAGGLPQTMWQGTPRALIAAALPQLAPSTSPALQSLARRLLLSNALLPAGQEAPDRPSLLGLRLQALLKLGIVAEAQPLLGALPPATAADETRDRSRIELYFANDDVPDACREVQAHVGQYPDHWWDRALVACQALTGKSSEAALGLDLLREQKVPRDAVFDAMIETLNGQHHRIERLPDPTPLRVMLLAATKEPLPADALAHAGPAALYAWANNAVLPPEQRLAAAEQAAQWGALTPAALGELYAKIEPKPDEGTALVKDGKPPTDPRSRAILYQLARSGQQNTRATAIEALLDEARKNGRFPLMARLLAPIIIELPTAGEPEGFADEAARALLAAGQADAALPWIAVNGNPPLLLLQRLGASHAPATDAPDDAHLLQQAIATLASRDSSAAVRQANLLVALLAAFDRPIGTPDWAPLLSPPHDASLPSAALWLDQEQAAAGKRVGETVLTSLLLATAGNHPSAEPIVLARAIRGLRTVGLDAEARSLAVEAAIDAGI